MNVVLKCPSKVKLAFRVQPHEVKMPDKVYDKLKLNKKSFPDIFKDIWPCAFIAKVSAVEPYWPACMARVAGIQQIQEFLGCRVLRDVVSNEQ